jgi:hypothetical protein
MLPPETTEGIMTRAEAVKVIERHNSAAGSITYGDLAHATGVLYEDEMKRRDGSWGYRTDTQAWGSAGRVIDQSLPSEPMPAGTLGALVASQNIGGDLVTVLNGGVSDFFISPLKDGTGRAGVFRFRTAASAGAGEEPGREPRMAKVGDAKVRQMLEQKAKSDYLRLANIQWQNNQFWSKPENQGRS